MAGDHAVNQMHGGKEEGICVTIRATLHGCGRWSTGSWTRPSTDSRRWTQPPSLLAPKGEPSVVGQDGAAAIRGYHALESAGYDLAPADARLPGASPDDRTACRREELTSGEAVPDAVPEGLVAPASVCTSVRRFDEPRNR